MTPGTVDALLFDVGGVVIRIDFNRAFARWGTLASCDPALLRQRFSHDLPYQRHERGEIGIADYFASLRASLGIDLADAQLREGWNAIFIEEMPGIAALLARVAPRLPIYAFANTNQTHAAHLHSRFGDVLGCFRHLFVSSVIGKRKPEAAAFDHVVNEMGVPAGRVLFFDDTLENVEGARNAGLQAAHVTSDTHVADTLAAIGL
jgi:putative hydrolase of the HAD superfamily